MKSILVLIFIIMTTLSVHAQNGNDPYQWLEDVEDEKALEWVKNMNENSLELFSSLTKYQNTYCKNFEIPNSTDRIVPKQMNRGYKCIPRFILIGKWN